MRNAMATSWMRSTAKWTSGADVPFARRIDSDLPDRHRHIGKAVSQRRRHLRRRIVARRRIEKIDRTGKSIRIVMRIAARILRQETAIALGRNDCGNRARARGLIWRLSQNVRQRQKVVGHHVHRSMPIQTA
jgi:hypothetical protein